ncbi:DUF1214 domain-containing protein [Novosphingobium taihuense]|nr:DUF1214 domain-containing protein [Novosphingobium taihuense]TWH87079.1 uncharacterized protein DUF1214 [Novosphingobium taihuense]
MPLADDAWNEYQKAIDEARRAALDWRFAQSPEMRTQAMYFISMMQAFGFNTYMGPRTAYPTFFSHLMFTPVEYNWGAPSPDFRYHWTKIDGSRAYRIWGTRGDTPWLHIQAQKGWWGDPDQANIGAWDVDNFTIAPDGSFEIIASPDERPGNWMKLDPAAPNTCLLVRDIWDEWEGTTGATIHIEPLDMLSDDTLVLTEEEIADRLRGIAYQTRFSLDTWMRMIEEVDQAVGSNRFWLPDEDTTKIGGNPLAAYVKMLYDLGPDDAIIIETEIPDVKHWSLQLADYFYQTTDYRFHQSSINNKQAVVDADGKVRIVMSVKDPGVPNWVDPSGFPKGYAQWRWYLSDRFPVPATKLVAVADLRDHLPAETPIITPEQRHAQLLARRAEVGRRFGV